MSHLPARRLFVAMLREEWRLHGRLFGGRRFALFPVLVAVVVAGATHLLVVTGTAVDGVFAGLHALAFVFGLHTGSVGFVGRDALRDVLGDLTLLIATARTLPLSRSRLFEVFLAKEVVYYAGLFLLPMAVGSLPALATTVGPGTGTVPPRTPSMAVAWDAAARAVLLWATLTGGFVLGIGSTLVGVSLVRRGRPGLLALGALAAGLGLAWAGGLDPVAYTPYGVFLAPALPRVGAATLVVGCVLLAGAGAFDVAPSATTRTRTPTFDRWRSRLGDPLATKTLLDVHRSSGGVGKVLFSGAVLLGVVATLVDLAGEITGVSPSVGVSFGAVLGLSGFTTYNWLTRFDDVASYRFHPVSVAAVFRGKFRAFLALGPLVGLGFYALALGWYGARPAEALVGGLALVGVACYVFGVTVSLAGLSPDEFLFDPSLFARFGAATMLPLVPVLVVGFALAPLSPALLGLVGLASVTLAAVGVGLYRRSLPKWTDHYRG